MPEVHDDLDRIFDHLFDQGVDDVPARIADILDSIDLLAHSPLIGRKAGGDKRELVIGKGARGYVALYRYVPRVDVVFVLAVRAQREQGYGRGT